MPVATTLKRLDAEEAFARAEAGAAFVDLRTIDAYLEVHIPGSIALLYEFGPGMAARARDCLPLDLPLIVLDLGAGDIEHAAASLRGKGFTVVGSLEDGINAWASARGETPASIDVHEGAEAPAATVLDVDDPGAHPPNDPLRIPADLLATRVGDVPRDGPVAVVAGYGVRAALAVGLLERAGISDIVFWKTRARRRS